MFPCHPFSKPQRLSKSARPNPKRLLTHGLVAASLLAAPLVFSASAGAASEAPDGTGIPMLISPELFDALENWSEAAVSVETVALDQNPEAIHLYADSLGDVYEGKSVEEHFQETYPEAHAAYLDALETETVTDSADFVAFVMASQDQAYSQWQQERALKGMRFEAFVGSHFPDIAEAVTQQSETAADQGITMGEYVDGLGDAQLSAELYDLLDGVSAPAGSTCHCWTVAAFPHQPNPWQAETLENYERAWGFPKKREKLWFAKSGRGAGKDFDFHRHSRHTVYEVTRTRTNYDSQMRVRMHCTENGNPGGANCQGSTCVGELAMKTAYASRVYEKVDVGGAWSNQSRMLTSDAAVLTYDPPGPAPAQELFRKGVAVSGDAATSWNSENALTLIENLTQLAVTLAPSTNLTISDLGNYLNDTTYNAIIGLIQHHGSESEEEVDMQVSFDTAGSAPFLLLPNTTLVFDLDTSSEFYSRGLGGTSDSRGKIDSSHYMVGVARNYQCAPTASAPAPQAFWLWSGSNGAPQSNISLQNDVRDWVAVELGATPPNTSSQVGYYP